MCHCGAKLGSFHCCPVLSLLSDNATTIGFTGAKLSDVEWSVAKLFGALPNGGC